VGGLKKAYIIQGIWIGQKASLVDNYSCYNLFTGQFAPIFDDYSCYKYRQAQNVTSGDYTKELDQFYSTPKHRKVRILEAYVLANIKFKDDDSNDYKYALELFLENKRVPCGGMVTRVLDGDTIEVREGIFEGLEKWGSLSPYVVFQSIRHTKCCQELSVWQQKKKYMSGLKNVGRGGVKALQADWWGRLLTIRRKWLANFEQLL
jgi:hypothetical protein